MLIDPCSVVKLLLHHGFLQPRHIVDGSFRIEDKSRRNLTYIVTTGCDENPGFVVKQGVGTERSRTIRHEGTVYRLLLCQPGFDQFERYMPSCKLFDNDNCLIVLSLIGAGQTLADFHNSTRRFNKTHAVQLGNALGLLHATTVQWPTTTKTAAAATAEFNPLTFQILYPNIAFYQICSGANLELLQIINRVLRYPLTEVVESWLPDCLIHGDVRLDNCCLKASAQNASQSVSLIDWELSSYGESFWDIGNVLADYLKLWVLSAPSLVSAEKSIESGRLSIEQIQRMLNYFWLSYVATRRFSPPQADMALLKSTRYSAVRLIQLAFELLQTENQFKGAPVTLVQIAANILENSGVAVTELFGISAATL